MAEYDINGRTVKFPSVGYQVLKGYAPTPRTHLLAWKKHSDPAVNLGITMLLHTMYTIAAIERPPFCVDDRQERIIYLLEHPNQTALDNVVFWIRCTIGTNYYSKCPYRDQLQEEMCNIEQKCEDEIWRYQHRGLLTQLRREEENNCKPNYKTLPPLPNE